MNCLEVEANRYATFRSWPPNPPVNPRELARDGFFATGFLFEVECNWCHLKISDWDHNQMAMGPVAFRHWVESPNCIFITCPTSCGNVPDRAELHPQENALSFNGPEVGDLLIEANRLATFKNWPNPNISPQSLAKAGFYYLNNSDKVRCAWCKGVIAQWEKGDNAFDEHKRFFPNCTRVQLGPLIEIASNGISSLGIQHHSPPIEPKYSSLDARLRTYDKWPISNVQQPLALAQAGLYYQNVDDHVRCFQCNMGLRAWEKDDEPWFEHAKWSPQCQFVRLCKGPKYVEQVQEAFQRHQRRQQLIDLTSLPQSAPTQISRIAPAMTIDEAMSTPPVLQALEIGIDAGAIRTVTQRRLQHNLQPYQTVEDLVRAVFDERDDENASSSGNTTPLRSETAEANILHAVSRMFNDIFSAAEREDTNNQTSDQMHAEPATYLNECRDIPPSMPVVRRPPVPDVVSTAVAAAAAAAAGAGAGAGAGTPTVMATASCAPDATSSACTLEQRERSSGGSEPEKCGKRASPARHVSLEEENRQLRDARACKVCLDEEVGVVFLPCGHLVTCVQCAPGVSHCPMCRTDIKGFVRTFLS